MMAAAATLAAGAAPAQAERAQIVVSLANRPTEFGVSDPETTQVFEAYRVENGICILEVF